MDNDTIRQMCGDIYDDAAWLTNLVENLLAVTKIKEGRMELKMQPHLIEEIVSEALQHISRKQEDHTITVHHDKEALRATSVIEVARVIFTFYLQKQDVCMV